MNFIEFTLATWNLSRFYAFWENVKPIQYLPVNEKIHPYIQDMSSLLCYRQLLILFTSVIIINKKLLFLLECQMRHKKTTAVAIAQLNEGGRKKGKKKTLISLALKSLRHKTENLPWKKKKGDTIRRLEHGLLINIHWEKWDHIIYASPWGTLSANELRQRMLAIMGFLILQDKNSMLCQPGGPSDQPQQALVGFPALLGSRLRQAGRFHCPLAVGRSAFFLSAASPLWRPRGSQEHSVSPCADLSPTTPPPGLVKACPGLAPAPGATFLFLGILPSCSSGSHFLSSGASTRTVEDNLVLPWKSR